MWPTFVLPLSQPGIERYADNMKFDLFVVFVSGAAFRQLSTTIKFLKE